MRRLTWLLRGRPMALMALAACASCVIGTDPADSEVSRSPRGATVEVRWQSAPRSWTRSGELLAVADDALLLVQGSQVVRYPFGAPVDIRTRGRGMLRRTLDLAHPDPETLEDVRVYARYPFGMTPEQATELARALGGEGVIPARRPSGSP